MIIMSLETFIEAIKDEDWHRINELSDKLGISISKLDQLSKVLFSFGLIKYDQKNRRIMIHPLWRRLPNEQPNEPKKLVANLIIPPHSGIDIDSAHISNVSEVDVEITLRFDNKIRDLTIAI